MGDWLVKSLYAKKITSYRLSRSALPERLFKEIRHG